MGLLTCDAIMSTRIKAFAAVSGAFYPGTRIPCNPKGQYVPIMDFHGMADTTVSLLLTGGGGSLS